MFDPTDAPRIFGTPLGVDFPRALVNGVVQRLTSHDPDALARVEMFVNTSRMQARTRALFDGQTRFLPRIRLITDLARDPALHDVPLPVAPLRRRLELRQLIAALLEKEPDLAPKAAAFDLADSLADLMDEMHSEGIHPHDLHTLDVGEMSEHWARSLKFISLVEHYFDHDTLDLPDVETRQRMVVEATIAKWRNEPPQHPILIAGSTGSRGATAMLMEAVARLPQGAVILPGFDYDLPRQSWAELDNVFSAQDHPQYRFAAFLKRCELSPSDLPHWTDDPPPEPERNRLVSLALRPAPVTDQWQVEGKVFKGVEAATQNLTLIETRTPRDEALAIAVVVRRAVEDRASIALITPDRNLTRQVAAALDRWRIAPDDSAGRPLALSAPGRLLRQTAQLLCEDTSGEALLALLKHPLTHSTAGTRGDHLRWTRDLELGVLRGRYAPPTAQALTDWAKKFSEEPARAKWASWVGDTFLNQGQPGEVSLTTLVRLHIELTERIARGCAPDGAGALWEQAAGQNALETVSDLAENAEFGGNMTAAAYRDLFTSVLNAGVVRDPVTAHPGVMFWGTLEARVQGADRVILAGLNDGTWPELPGPDPWLNRKMRMDAGLLLPERRIGLSAHDFQQAIATREVFLTRATRDEDSETIPSRWLNRLCNLMGGMSEAGQQALTEMRERGDHWVKLATQLDEPVQPVTPAPRPSPAPPVSARPTELSVTGVTKLIRDPYAIYADKVLHLRPLEPIRQTADARIRGTVLHEVFERYVAQLDPVSHPDDDTARLMTIAQEVLDEHVPWPATRILWLARIGRVADWFVNEERMRRTKAINLANEVWGEAIFDVIGFTLRAKADRIDQRPDGQLEIYDYKSGQPPTEKMQKHYDKQLLLEAVIARLGGFRDISAAPVASVAYIGLTPQETKTMPLSDAEVDLVQAELLTLIRAYHSPDQGFTARRAVHKQRFDGDYDHLARFGEWDDSADPVKIRVGQ
ncbi:double-strand break repair protein AddB [Aliiroseovarius zhejiangensis]|uniref:Double-strand break repair protein AddB n=1 Tax=Aliiroseovarius zhejiangensis TaxID=1632025 RepID=A0ABQ3J5W6_9RHOB|nr:double-strand break repair protein AddB [Aliiroseovarius zhejiangensis]GHF02276.1 double-strand break repair protein AddB [Aliiroseovarius zhejiangensis]